MSSRSCDLSCSVCKTIESLKNHIARLEACHTIIDMTLNTNIQETVFLRPIERGVIGDLLENPPISKNRRYPPNLHH